MYLLNLPLGLVVGGRSKIFIFRRKFRLCADFLFQDSSSHGTREKDSGRQVWDTLNCEYCDKQIQNGYTIFLRTFSSSQVNQFLSLLLSQVFEADPMIKFTYAWNRLNVYRQRVYGVTTALVKVTYERKGLFFKTWVFS